MCPKDAVAGPGIESTSISTTATSTVVKTVYLIRHAESEENRRIAALSRTFRTLGKFSFPKASDVSASAELLHVSAQVDSNVSEIGARQIAHMKEQLHQHKFLDSSGIQLVAHSPLLRARETSEGMLGCVGAAAAPSSSPSTSEGETSGREERRAESVSRVLETDLLLEKTPAEWTPLYYSSFKKRITDFENWLGRQDEERVALVGHSQFFKAMLGVDFKFGNCEVWKVDFDASKTNGGGYANGTTVDEDPATNSASCQWTLPPQWSNLEKKFACDVESSPKTV